VLAFWRRPICCWPRISPAAFALIVEGYGYVTAEWVLCAGGLISPLGTELMALG